MSKDKKITEAERPNQEEVTAADSSVQHVPGQTEEVRKPDESKCLNEIPAEGNNLANVRDRAFADTPPANLQPPVEKTFVSPKDEPAKD